MQRIFNILMCVFAILVSTKATAQKLQFDASAEVQQGQTATLSIVLNNSEKVRGFQFDLTLSEGLSPAVSKVGNTDHDLAVSKVGESKWRVLCYSSENTEYPAGYGTVVNVSLSIPEDYTVGSYSVYVSNAYLSAHDNSKITVADFSASLNVQPKYIAVESITLNFTSLSLLIGQSADLTASALPEDTTDKTVTWTTSDASIATVSADGKVSAVGVGTATISAKCGEASATCNVTVTPDAYTITYLVDGEVYHTVTVKIGSAITPIAEPTKEGYTFSGWSEVPETMPANDVTVTGSFTVNTYTITYKVDGEEYKSETYDFGATVVSVAEPTREGKTFSGWSKIPETMPAHDVEIVGSFGVNTYKIIYVVDGETYKTEMYEYGSTITSITEPTKEGYTFSGWSEMPETMPADDVTVTGTFNVNSYTITYIVDGEVFKSETKEFGAEIIETEAPEGLPEWLVFEGWDYVPATMPAEDVIVTAVLIFLDNICDAVADHDERYYTINGVEITRPTKSGVYIVRRADGTTTKVRVK